MNFIVTSDEQKQIYCYKQRSEAFDKNEQTFSVRIEATIDEALVKSQLYCLLLV